METNKHNQLQELYDACEALYASGPTDTTNFSEEEKIAWMQDGFERMKKKCAMRNEMSNIASTSISRLRSDVIVLRDQYASDTPEYEKLDDLRKTLREVSACFIVASPAEILRIYDEIYHRTQLYIAEYEKSL